MKAKAKKTTKPKAEKQAGKKLQPKEKAVHNNKKSEQATEKISAPIETITLSGSPAEYQVRSVFNNLQPGTIFKERSDLRWQAYDADGNQLDVIINREDMDRNPNVFQQIK